MNSIGQKGRTLTLSTIKYQHQLRQIKRREARTAIKAIKAELARRTLTQRA